MLGLFEVIAGRLDAVLYRQLRGGLYRQSRGKSYFVLTTQLLTLVVNRQAANHICYDWLVGYTPLTEVAI
ncbi:hypothetical protein XA68_16953 [Ophiocordyceps unilateralis]|uniref:Uncharacterized protein n=1 Tax=Ophiocordyceps unilateralis TaxID=268505 RepID=A0A2A9P3W5_OPHUN|nr:hypothetical protein XA68_16953 [Ophiocordyceps unilateralis]